ncbi:MAG: hypothetical protein H6604_02085 [Flavobacteriales bacterium]|nr:hypothetical protein [Flavobacteriales bacterium]
MRQFIVIIFILINGTLYSQLYDYMKIRTEFVKSIEDETTAKKWYKELKDKDLKGDAILEGYRACFYFSMAKHAIFYEKLSYFLKGKKLLEKTISKNRNHIELRFLRLSTQKQIPKILNYDQNIPEDTKFLKESLHKVQEKPFKEAIEKLINQ